MEEYVHKALGYSDGVLLSLVIDWLLYLVFNSSMRSLSAVIDSSFGEIFGMLPFCGNNLTIFVICSALVFMMYMQ